MKKLIIFLVLLNINLYSKGKVLLYNGAHSLKESVTNLYEFFKRNGYEVIFFDQPKSILTYLNEIKIITFGGLTEDFTNFIKQFDTNLIKNIKLFLFNGGSFIAIGNSSFIATIGLILDDNIIIKGIGLVPFNCKLYAPYNKPSLIEIYYKNKIYIGYTFNNPYFLVPDISASKKILFYDNKLLASIIYPFGKGKVLLIGPNLEADKNWINTNVINYTKWKDNNILEEIFFEFTSKF